MPSLQSADDRFGTKLTIIEGGAGDFTGVLVEPNQGQTPSYQFTMPRRLLRVTATLPVAEGMVVKSSGGAVFMVGRHGDSEDAHGSIFRSFRLFEADGQFSWQRRGKAVDPVTRLAVDTGLVAQPMIWGAYEPDREMFDRQLRSNFEQARFITNADVKKDDVVHDMKVARVDMQLGLRLVTLG